MKKMLLIFMIVDLVFVGTILTLSHRHQRNIASDGGQTMDDLSDLSEGQKNKWHLVQTFQFAPTSFELKFSTDKLQMICETSTAIELEYVAQNVAVGGESPSISSIFNCEQIRKNQNQTDLITKVSDFKSMHFQKLLNLEVSQLRARNIYSDEEFPSQWRLSEIKVVGPNTFKINQFEIQKTLLKNFDFNLLL